MLFSVFLLVFLFWGSSVVWWNIISRWRQKRPALERVEGTNPDWDSVPQLMVVFIALVFICLAFFMSTEKQEDREPLTLTLVILQVVISLGLVVVLMAPLSLGSHSLQSYGIKLSNLSEQLRLGFLGFLSAILPMAISLIMTLPFRGRETEHSLLKLLSGSPDVLTVVMVAIAAVICAPLWEELQFRVILQGWLSARLPSWASIGIVAVSFSMVHGWRDGLALIPLALVLGYVFDRRRSYLAVVVIHALFNGTMILLELLNLESSQ